jgi:PBP1b-binding outer membrane lipoprotein LpoB
MEFIMKKTLFVLLIVSLFVVGCVRVVTPVANSIDITNADFSKATKTGKDCFTNFLWFTFGSNDISKAMDDGGITKVIYVSQENACLVVHGY